MGIAGAVLSNIGLQAYGFIGSLILATIGAVVLLFLIGLMKKA
ncbi:GlsB/YeaQ/YmgE family stress response membrane protein [Arsukibacterium sp.]